MRGVQCGLVVATVFLVLLHGTRGSRESAFIGYSELRGGLLIVGSPVQTARSPFTAITPTPEDVKLSALFSVLQGKAVF